MNKTMSILRLAISIAIVFTISCSSGDDNGSGGSGGGSGYNGPLIGKWYANQELADELPEYYSYWFQSNGKLLVYAIGDPLEATYTATANTITIYNEPAYYTISGNVLTITDPKGTGMTGLSPGTYYKPK